LQCCLLAVLMQSCTHFTRQFILNFHICCHFIHSQQVVVDVVVACAIQSKKLINKSLIVCQFIHSCLSSSYILQQQKQQQKNVSDVKYA